MELALTPRTIYSENELLAINQLRKKVKDLELPTHNNAFLIKWLIVRDFNVQKAEYMLRKSILWRRENDIDKILEWNPPEVLKTAMPFRISGYDDEGNTVIVIRLKDIDVHILSKVEPKEYIKYRIQLSEKCIKDMRARNKSMSLSGDQFIVILDFEGFSLNRNLINSNVLEITQELTLIFDENYPEIPKIHFLVYAPKWITCLMFLAKSVISKKNLEKVKVFDSNLKRIGNELLKHIPSSVLPTKYGGTNFEFDEEIN